jgi:hypothetical protein
MLLWLQLDGTRLRDMFRKFNFTIVISVFQGLMWIKLKDGLMKPSWTKVGLEVQQSLSPSNIPTERIVDSL